MKLKMINLIILTAFLMLFSTCDPLSGPLSISERITAFVNTLNSSDRSDIQDHFHPDMTNYNQLADPGFLDSSPLDSSNGSVTITQVSSADHSGGGKDITCDFTNDNGTYNNALVLWMLQEGDDWKIRRLDLTISTTYTLSNIK